MAVAKSLSAIEHKYKGLTRKARIRHTDYADFTEKPLSTHSFSVLSVTSAYQKCLITTIPNEPFALHDVPRIMSFYQRGKPIKLKNRRKIGSYSCKPTRATITPNTAPAMISET